MFESVVLLSGGIDSALCLAMEVRRFGANRVVALSVSYGQSHRCELHSAQKLARRYQVEHRVITTLLPTSSGCVAGEVHRSVADNVSSAYVPARNTVLLSLALCCAESVGAQRIIIGATAADSAGFPDCRHGYFRAWQTLANVGTAVSERIRVHTPVIDMSKAQIGRACKSMGVPLELTWSCYHGGMRGGCVDGPEQCGECDACVNRLKVMLAAGVDLTVKAPFPDGATA